jgi:hypothetical protein
VPVAAPDGQLHVSVGAGGTPAPGKPSYMDPGGAGGDGLAIITW